MVSGNGPKAGAETDREESVVAGKALTVEYGIDRLLVEILFAKYVRVGARGSFRVSVMSITASESVGSIRLNSLSREK